MVPRGGIEPPTQGFSVLDSKIETLYICMFQTLVFMLVFIFGMRKMKDLTRL